MTTAPRMSRISRLLTTYLLATSSQFFTGSMALSHLRRSAAFHPSRHMRSFACFNSAGGCHNNIMIGTELAGGHTARHHRIQIMQRQPFASALHSSATARSNSNDAIQSDAHNIISNESSKDKEWSNYEKLVRKLYMTNLFNPVKLGLENMDLLHKALGSPMDQVRVHTCVVGLL